MAIDFTRYQPPGIYTEDVGGPQLAVSTSVPTAVAIFGTSVGYRTFRESVKINADAAEGVPSNSPTLTKTGIKVVTGSPVVFATSNVDITAPGATITGIDPIDVTADPAPVTPEVDDLVYLSSQTTSTQNGLYTYKGASTPLVAVVDSFKVVNSSTGAPYVNGLDYEVVRVSTNDTPSNDRDDLYAIKRIDRGNTLGIHEGDTVQISYRYVGIDRRNAAQGDYFDVYAYYDYDDVRDHYGEPFDAAGNIQSEITLAAKFAFINGAATVLTCAVDTAVSEQPSAQYLDALNKFRDEPQLAILVPGTGQSWIYELVKEHVNAQSNNKYERRAILGIDGSSSTIDTAARQTYAETIADERIALISPTKFGYYAPELGKEIILGGQFMAAAVAGKSVSQIAAMPLTRKVINGFTGPAELPIQREGEKNLESQNGLMVVEKTPRNQVQVRHGVTTKSYPADLTQREWSIIGQRDVMVYRIRDYLDADGLIGMPIYDTTLIQVKASAESALQSLIRDQIIVGYQNLKVRQLATLPDVIEVRYEWKPAYPLNYIVVRYSVAVMTGDVVVAGT